MWSVQLVGRQNCLNICSFTNTVADWEFYSLHLRSLNVRFQTYVLAPRLCGETGASLIMLHTT